MEKNKLNKLYKSLSIVIIVFLVYVTIGLPAHLLSDYGIIKSLTIFGIFTLLVYLLIIKEIRKECYSVRDGYRIKKKLYHMASTVLPLIILLLYVILAVIAVRHYNKKDIETMNKKCIHKNINEVKK